MVFNDEVLFIHIGKTGGMSTANYLCRTLNAPVYNAIPERAQGGDQIGHETTLVGRRHATLEEAQAFFKERGKSIDDFKEIFAVIRNPYNLEISLFNYYKRKLKERPHMLDNLPARKKIIKSDSFEDFVKGKFFHRPGINIRKYLVINSKIPKNVRIIKFENLREEFLKIGELYGNSNPDFPHLNKSTSGDVKKYVTPELEVIIYRKYHWVFKQGRYERLKF